VSVSQGLRALYRIGTANAAVGARHRGAPSRLEQLGDSYDPRRRRFTSLAASNTAQGSVNCSVPCLSVDAKAVGSVDCRSASPAIFEHWILGRSLFGRAKDACRVTALGVAVGSLQATTEADDTMGCGGVGFCDLAFLTTLVVSSTITRKSLHFMRGVFHSSSFPPCATGLGSAVVPPTPVVLAGFHLPPHTMT
jgi:hypothetical protein